MADTGSTHLNPAMAYSPLHGRKSHAKKRKAIHPYAPLHGRKAGFQRLPSIALHDAWGHRDMLQSMQSGRR